MRRLAVVVPAALVASLLAAWPAAGAPDRAAGQRARVDFNGDGFADLVVGAPSETVGAGFARGAAGAVSVYYASGGPGGTVTPGPAFTQGSGGLGGTAEGGDQLGAAME
jgi:hypothetical protein